MMPNRMDSEPVQKPIDFDVRVANVKVLKSDFPIRYATFRAEVELMIAGGLTEQRQKYYLDYTDENLQELLDEV